MMEKIRITVQSFKKYIFLVEDSRYLIMTLCAPHNTLDGGMRYYFSFQTSDLNRNYFIQYAVLKFYLLLVDSDILIIIITFVHFTTFN